jgi:hypothetical protein
MTDTLAEHADHTLHGGEPLIEMDNVGKSSSRELAELSQKLKP